MTTKAQADWLLATVTADTGLAALKGVPAFDRPATASSAYVEWRQSAPQEATRIGQTVTRWAAQFAVVMVATSEIGMWALVDAAETMIQTRTEASISGVRYRIAWGALSRLEQSEDTIEALRYAAVTIATLTR